MIIAAVVLLLVTALTTPIWSLATRKRRREAPEAVVRRLDVIGAVVLLMPAAVAAVLAAAAGPATGFLASAVPVLAALAAVTGGGPVVRTVLVAGGVGVRPDTGSDAPGAPDHEPGNDADTPDSTENPGPGPAGAGEAGPLRGGRVIGYLERLAVVTTLMAGWPEGLAIILAVKSLARYPELRAPHAAEQFIMGTFASVMWAVGMAGVEHLLTH
ncbi:hypothetical protein [Gordonia sp. KTR9]|uniref:hypothetical protein n=1 Tax=Gordonia sp. KTR9 TaxID=337191 RepID=UPI00027DDF2C|nr:hypothetical protein [Gordonia sp. KTR9]AFR48969.1 hypothetical protein KTR9_2332 [Gordonia sp. KTR9]